MYSELRPVVKLIGSTDKQHGKYDMREKVNTTDRLQPSGCNGTVLYIISIIPINKKL